MPTFLITSTPASQRSLPLLRCPLQSRPFAVQPPPAAAPPHRPVDRPTPVPQAGHRLAHLLFAPLPARLLLPPTRTLRTSGDPDEQHAEHVATQVVHQLQAPAWPPAAQGQMGQRVARPDEAAALPRPPVGPRQPGRAGRAAAPELATAIQQRRGRGRRLPAPIRTPMEQALGADFREVYVHTDAPADQLTQFLEARAFTTGADIFFQQGAYHPESREGQALLAHELTHVVQQRGPVRPPRGPGAHAAGPEPYATTGTPAQAGARSPTSAMLIQCALTKTNQKDRVNKPDLGLFEYTFDWQATAEHRNGYIVQDIDRQREPRDADHPARYWEAWWVDDTYKIRKEKDGTPKDGAHDTWSQWGYEWGTQGWLQVKGTVYWAPEGSPAAQTIAGWQGDGKAVPMAGALKASKEPPPALGSSIDAAQETRRFQWDATGRTTAQLRRIFAREWEELDIEELIRTNLSFAKAAATDVAADAEVDVDDKDKLGVIKIGYNQLIPPLKAMLEEMGVDKTLPQDVDDLNTWLDTQFRTQVDDRLREELGATVEELEQNAHTTLAQNKAFVVED